MDTLNKSSKRLCEVKDCAARILCKGFCSKHYERFSKYGDPLQSRWDTVSLSFRKKENIKNHLTKYRKITKPHCFLKTPCWEWTRSQDSKGYGSQQIAGRSYKVHRVSASVFLNFDIKSSLFVCHKCDNPPCFNPEHLWIGTNTDNMRDMIKKGRDNKVKGSASGMAKLSEEKILAIRKMLKNGETQKSIARTFGVTQATISGINRLLTWAHVG